MPVDTVKLFEFIKLVMPSALELVHDLYDATQGNAAASIKDIQDRRAEIAGLRARTDAALRAKHGG